QSTDRRGGCHAVSACLARPVAPEPSRPARVPPGPPRRPRQDAHVAMCTAESFSSTSRAPRKRGAPWPLGSLARLALGDAGGGRRPAPRTRRLITPGEIRAPTPGPVAVERIGDVPSRPGAAGSLLYDGPPGELAHAPAKRGHRRHTTDVVNGGIPSTVIVFP